jgi:hypothetical protein
MADINKVIAATSCEITNIVYLKGKIKGLKLKTVQIDEIVPKAGELVLVKDQTAKNQNGLYQIKRNEDTVKPFVMIRYKNREHDKDLILIENGKANKNTKWTCSNTGMGKQVEYINIGFTETIKLQNVTIPDYTTYKSLDIKIYDGLQKAPVQFDTEPIIKYTYKYSIMTRSNEKEQKFIINICGKDCVKYEGEIIGGTKIFVYYIGGHNQNIGCMLTVRKL